MPTILYQNLLLQRSLNAYESNITNSPLKPLKFASIFFLTYLSLSVVQAHRFEIARKDAHSIECNTVGMEALVFEACLILGLALIVIAFVLGIIRNAQRPRRKNYAPKQLRNKSRAKTCNYEIPWEINYDAFNIPELSFSNDFASTNTRLYASDISFADDTDDTDSASPINTRFGLANANASYTTAKSTNGIKTKNTSTAAKSTNGIKTKNTSAAAKSTNGIKSKNTCTTAYDANQSDDFAIVDDEDTSSVILNAVNGTSSKAAQSDPNNPPLVLASLIEIQNIQERDRARQEAILQTPQAPTRPRLLGDTACELGVRYFDSVLSQHVMPRAAQALTNNTNIVIAKNALKATHPSAIFSHGAIAQRIGQNAVCLFEPLETPIADVENALSQIDDIMQNRTIFVILSNLDECAPENMAHIAPLCHRYGVAKTNIYIEQPDHSFINYIENARDYVPARIDANRMPPSFFTEIFDYAQDAYDRGDYEAVLRTIDPLIRPLLDRMRLNANFPPLLIAQALNLIGMTQREIGCDDRAVNAFEASLTILQQIEDYNAIKSVKANLGITLALSTPATLPKIELAIRHLNEVTQLNPRDAEAWLFLANSYIEQFRFTNAKSLLGRALRAYDKSYEIEPAQDVALCMRELERQMGRSPRTLIEQPHVAPIKPTSTPQNHDAF